MATSNWHIVTRIVEIGDIHGYWRYLAIWEIGISASTYEVAHITKGGYVNMKPAPKWRRPMNLACTIDKATGVYIPPFQRSYRMGVCRCIYMIMSNSSCQ